MGRILSYYFTSDKEEALLDKDDIICDLYHQRVGHELPCKKIYSKKDMIEAVNEYLSREKYYEVSVLTLLLSEWEKNYCHFSYD